MVRVTRPLALVGPGKLASWRKGHPPPDFRVPASGTGAMILTGGALVAGLATATSARKFPSPALRWSGGGRFGSSASAVPLAVLAHPPPRHLGSCRAPKPPLVSARAGCCACSRSSQRLDVVSQSHGTYVGGRGHEIARKGALPSDRVARSVCCTWPGVGSSRIPAPARSTPSTIRARRPRARHELRAKYCRGAPWCASRSDTRRAAPRPRVFGRGRHRPAPSRSVPPA